MTRARRRCAVVAALLLLALVGWALGPATWRPHRVRGASMEPALVEGDWIRVRGLGDAAPRRHELVVFREPGSGRLAVKRVAGLPGEVVQVLGEDVWTDGRPVVRKVSGVLDLVPQADARGAALDALLGLAAAGFEPGAAGGWTRPAGAGRVRLPLPAPVRDGYLRRGEFVPGARPVRDAGLELRFALGEPEAAVALHHQAGRDHFTAALDGSGRLRVRRVSGGAAAGGAEAAPALLHEEGGHAAASSLFLAVVDGELVVAVDDKVVFRRSVGLAEPRRVVGLPLDQAAQAVLAVEVVGAATLRRLRVGRDLVRIAGTVGGATGFRLGPDEYFLLGDHPETSRDSRHYGAVERGRILGRVGGRLWPRGWNAFGWPLE